MQYGARHGTLPILRRKTVAELPYKFTICSPEEAPKQITASCALIGMLLKTSIDGDLTIDDRRNGYWQSWENRPLVDSPIEARVHDMIKERKK